MPETLASMSRVRAAAFRCGSLSLEEGSLGIVASASLEQGRAFVDVLMGLAPPDEGEGQLLGQNVHEWPESQRLGLLAEVGHAGSGLVSNLKVWENLSLPALFHQRATPDEIEQRLLQALDRLPNKEEWMQNRLFALPDTLSSYAVRMSSLIRCAIARPRLLVTEFLLDDLDGEALERLQAMLEWMREQQPKLAVLMVHRGATEDGDSPLPRLRPDWMIQLEDPQS